jgi:hypothetical protein
LPRQKKIHNGLQKMSGRVGNYIYKEPKSVCAKSRQFPRKFDPEKYGMIICPGCNGHGFIEDYVGRNVCLKCGGFGLIKKEEDPGENDDG